MNSARIHFIVQYIRQQGEFPFDVMDVEAGIGSVLAFFGVTEPLEQEDVRVLREEFQKLAAAEQSREMARLVPEAAPADGDMEGADEE